MLRRTDLLLHMGKGHAILQLMCPEIQEKEDLVLVAHPDIF